MQIIVHTDQNVTVGKRFAEHMTTELETRLRRFRDRLTRVEVRLSDENARKVGTADRRCAIEARPAGREPVAVTNSGPSLVVAFDGAVDKLEGLLEARLGRESDHKGAPSIRTTIRE